MEKQFKMNENVAALTITSEMIEDTITKLVNNGKKTNVKYKFSDAFTSEMLQAHRFIVEKGKESDTNSISNAIGQIKVITESPSTMVEALDNINWKKLYFHARTITKPTGGNNPTDSDWLFNEQPSYSFVDNGNNYKISALIMNALDNIISSAMHKKPAGNGSGESEKQPE